MNSKLTNMIEAFLYSSLTPEEMNSIAQAELPGEYTIEPLDRGICVKFKSRYHKLVWKMQHSDLGEFNDNKQ